MENNNANNTHGIDLIQNDRKHRMVIPASVEQKIRMACATVPDKEWSGVLFYTYKGSFEKGLTVTCKDILVMDVGSSAYTEWCADAEVISYMAEQDLLDCQMGIIHSHNHMATFFSGTDTETLLAEGKDRNNIVSLIVNNAGKYSAAITRRLKTTGHVTEEGTYEFFGEGPRDYQDSYETEDEYVEYFMFNIERKEPKGLFGFIDRLKEIMTPKVASRPIQSSYPTYHPMPYGSNPIGDYGQPFRKPVEAPAVKTATTPVAAGQQSWQPSPTPKFNAFNPMAPVDSSLATKVGLSANDKADLEIDTLALQLTSGNVTAEAKSNTDLDAWVANKMAKVFEARFGKDTGTKSDFSAWLDGMMDFIIYYTHDEELDGFAPDEKDEVLAENLYNRLAGLPKNIYLTVILHNLKQIFDYER